MEFIRLWRSFYSNKLRGLRKKAGTDDQIPALIESEVSPKEFRKNWARLIQKIYPPRRINPLLCPKCLGSMKIISFIEDEEVISKILKQNYCAPFFLDIQGLFHYISPSKKQCLIFHDRGWKPLPQSNSHNSPNQNRINFDF
jgi:hypothetical protein